MELIEPTQLFNLLNQESVNFYPCLSDPVYLLLLDARTRADYDESHVATARFVALNSFDEYSVPYDSELDCKTHVVVYDSKTSSLDDADGTAVKCATTMWDMGSRNRVKILKGGYEKFSAIYPFLRTTKITYMPRELDVMQTYPIEIYSERLYFGNWQHANIPYMQKDLKVTGHVNCSDDKDTFYTEFGTNLIAIQEKDEPRTNLYSKFQMVCDFIDTHNHNGGAVVVYSSLGISRSATFIIAYVMYYENFSLKDAIKYVKSCCQKICPNQGFLDQLSQWERDLFEKVVPTYSAVEYVGSVDTFGEVDSQMFQYNENSVMNLFDLPADD